MSGFFSALQFFTVLPAPLARPTASPAFSLAYFPLVGLLLGAILVGIDWALRLFLPLSLVNGAVIIALIILTGGLHLDGFMDSCDAIPGAQSASRRLEILKDVRVGSYGILGVLSLIMAKYLALSALPGPLRLPSLLLMPVLGRWAMALAIPAFPYARASGLGKAMKDGATRRSLVLPTLLALAVSALALQAVGLATLAGAGLLAILMGGHFTRRLTGLTGDTYGAINEVVEVAALIIIPLAAGAYRIQP
ncbi:MAG: adenosylcobinamide-GDP ribazoletransferase [Dehalococcoidia bacterium]|nr:adenosylcobinamide-GDP ribazoletransferase [Dehalococcoidia bacterium]